MAQISETGSGLTPLGVTNARGAKKKFGIKLDDRRRHVYIIGKTGVGKTTLLENMAISDIQSGRGVAIVDPHGEFAEKLLSFVPEERLQDVIYFDPSDMENPIAFNPMEQVNNEFRHLVASGIMGVFKKIWPDAWSARMEYILNNTLLALLEYPGSTLLGILRMFAEPNYRKQIVDNLKDPVIKAFWQNEFARYTQRLETEALAAIQNKVGQFVSNPLIRNILGQSRSTLNMREIMDSGKIFIANLSKGKMGEDNSALLGAMIISRMQLAAMSRVDVPEEERRDFFMYVDEFQNFATDSFAHILSEARKYRLSLVLAHQYIGQLVTNDGNTKVRDAVFGNVGTIITFRIGAADAEFMEKEFMPEFLEQDLVNLAKANVYIKLMIDGVASRPFSATTLPPQSMPFVSHRDVIIENTRARYGTPRKVVEARIAGEWTATEDDMIRDKLGRQGERHLGATLVPKAASVSREPFPGRPRENAFGPPARQSVRENFQREAVHPGGQPSRSVPAERPVDRPIARSMERPMEKLVERPVERPIEKTAERRPIEAPSEKPPERRLERSADSARSAARTEAASQTMPAAQNEPARTKQYAQPVRPAGDAESERPALAFRPLQSMQAAQPKEKPRDSSPKQFSKPSIDIGELRRAIRESLEEQTAEAGLVRDPAVERIFERKIHERSVKKSIPMQPQGEDEKISMIGGKSHETVERNEGPDQAEIPQAPEIGEAPKAADTPVDREADAIAAPEEGQEPVEAKEAAETPADEEGADK